MEMKEERQRRKDEGERIKDEAGKPVKEPRMSGGTSAAR